jgi:hypothetical protein
VFSYYRTCSLDIPGRYDYDADNNKEVELVYQTYVANKRMCTRFVHSEYVPSP